MLVGNGAPSEDEVVRIDLREPEVAGGGRGLGLGGQAKGGKKDGENQNKYSGGGG